MTHFSNQSNVQKRPAYRGGEPGERVRITGVVGNCVIAEAEPKLPKA